VIEDRLGAGGMKIVYRARQISLGRLVALKVLGPALDSDEGKARFRREVQAVAKLDHPGIASVFFIGQDGQACFLAMEFIDGVSPRKLMEKLITSPGQGLTVESALEALRSFGSQRAAPIERFDEPTQTHISPLDDKLPHESMTSPLPVVAQFLSRPAYIRRL
jgi:serine/threonine protein kinase